MTKSSRWTDFLNLCFSNERMSVGIVFYILAPIYENDLFICWVLEYLMVRLPVSETLVPWWWAWEVWVRVRKRRKLPGEWGEQGEGEPVHSSFKKLFRTSLIRSTFRSGLCQSKVRHMILKTKTNKTAKLLHVSLTIFAVEMAEGCRFCKKLS